MDHHESTESGLRDDGDAKGPYMTKYYTVFEVEPSTAPYKRVGSQGLRAAAPPVHEMGMLSCMCKIATLLQYRIPLPAPLS